MVATGFANDGIGGAWPLVVRLAGTDGSAAHRWATILAGAAASRRDLADAAHALCLLHGNHPGLADHARARRAQPDADSWLAAVADAFAGERAALAQVVSHAGPLPSTPGQADSEATILAQRHALSTLSASDRCGCASGAVAALVLDWPAVRRVLDRAATAFGLDLAPPRFPADSEAAVASLSRTIAAERAIAFGADQLLAQHRGLWSLLEARAEARNRS